MECLEWCPICRSAELLRTTVTPELREQAETLQREALSIFQAFLAAYVERTAGAGRPGPNGGSGADRPEGGTPADGKRNRDPGHEVTDIPLE